jgi:4-hydroxythreonine-4-phosphate dehydrogenase
MNYQKNDKIKLAISIGDPNGIGMEVIVKALRDPAILDFCTPLVYGHFKFARFVRRTLDIQDFSFNPITKAEQANPKLVNLVEVWKDDMELQPGESTVEGGQYALKSLQAAVGDLASNKVDALVTAPINKNNIKSEAFPFNGHTEFLAHYSNEEFPLMLLVSEGLRIATLTGHVPLSEVAGLISKELILKKLSVFQQSLQSDFGIHRPVIAVLGLNPHAGDKGTLGSEEQEFIIPAIERARQAGMLVTGPFASDGFFGSGAWKKVDGVLAMYHDQGLIPFKTIAFESGVNYTAGLPIVRTSPDHGTAYDLVGKNVADEQSMRNAIYLAVDIYKKRREFKDLSANALKTENQP